MTRVFGMSDEIDIVREQALDALSSKYFVIAQGAEKVRAISRFCAKSGKSKCLCLKQRLESLLLKTHGQVESNNVFSQCANRNVINACGGELS